MSETEIPERSSIGDGSMSPLPGDSTTRGPTLPESASAGTASTGDGSSPLPNLLAGLGSLTQVPSVIIANVQHLTINVSQPTNNQDGKLVQNPPLSPQLGVLTGVWVRRAINLTEARVSFVSDNPDLYPNDYATIDKNDPGKNDIWIQLFTGDEPIDVLALINSGTIVLRLSADAKIVHAILLPDNGNLAIEVTRSQIREGVDPVVNVANFIKCVSNSAQGNASAIFNCGSHLLT